MTDLAAVRVLFVEDSEDDVDLAVRALKREGLTPVWRVASAEAEMRALLREAPPQAILSDFSMPGFDGVQALRIAQELAPSVPFIFLSGTIGEERAIEAIRMGATDYVLKNNLRRLGYVLKRALAEAEDRERVRKAEEERARLVEILEATSDYVGMSDPEGRQIYINTAGSRLIGRSPEAILGQPIFDIYPAWARDIILHEARPRAEREGIWEGETAMLDGEGREVPVSQVIIAHRREGSGEVRFFSAIARDISERKAYEAQLKYLANYSPLTGLPNRSLLGDRALQAIAHARRTGRSCGVVVVNIDRFKRLNQSYGHEAGNELLKALAGRMEAAVRAGDTIAHLGADSFAVLATDLARDDDVHYVARKVIDALATPMALEGRPLHITASVGASTYPRDGEDFELLQRNAEAAMHRVKAQGGNGFQFYAAAMTQGAVERLELESGLRVAIAQKQLLLHYQPQVAIDGGAIVGVEALMRWEHPERGPISPAQFIPIAEESGLIEPLGVWALTEAVRQLAEWRAAGQRLRMAVNVSARQFRSEGFVEAVARALHAHAIEPSCLELELTESALIDDRVQADRLLAELKDLGVLIAVDDFGTGYSSLSYLSGLPVDCVKIDRAFVTQAAKGGRDAAIVQAIVSLGHSLGLRVLAEGIETAEQLEFLSQQGCDEGQGYLFARPSPASGLGALLAAGRLGPNTIQEKQ